VTILAPSILSADFGRLAEQVKGAERGGAGVIHVDVMDGRFVPNLTIGPLVVQAVRKATQLPLDVHLMIEEPDRFLQDFVEAGASWISVQVEATTHLQRTVTRIRELGARPGVALNPSTPLVALEEILPELDFVLLMTVNPGFGGQTFIPSSLDKIRRLRKQIAHRGLTTQIEIDGGISADNIRAAVEAGTDIVVAGTAVFAAGPAGPESGIRALLEACE
jgi:ribulose-phosphate 3-epimerase